MERGLGRARRAARAQAALHWRLAFPTVFLRRDRPGFDVILGNPPWEEVTVERLGFYARHMPGIKSVSPQSRAGAPDRGVRGDVHDGPRAL